MCGKVKSITAFRRKYAMTKYTIGQTWPPYSTSQICNKCYRRRHRQGNNDKYIVARRIERMRTK